MAKRFWPIHLGFNRCTANWNEGEDLKFIRCNKIVWPWEDVFYNPDPEDTGILHHECYHKEHQSTWRGTDTPWNEYLWCEHGRK